ncbi:MAG: copper resistance protein NlpE N-terminal domain-containing protein [Neisseriaceae bacterium]|nr:copper resistance protein NlpE N-terminal domain-containing protein [Neisseriaceae bacterium]MBP6863349.1 copper resistance protein NlpE N-terminal domain-containing protein [Neisseriaceae bacterium]
MIKFMIPLLGSLFVLAACSQEPAATDAAPSETLTQASPEAADATAVDSEHNAQNALDWAGTYEGTLPCADCEGIKTTLVLNADGSYERTSEYLKDVQPGEENTFTDKGQFTWNEAGNIVILDEASDRTQYFVAENRLEMRDQEGTAITGALADQYILQKVPE